MSDDAPSLRRRLSISMLSLAGLALVACAVSAYVAFHRTVWSNFDATLAQDAAALALIVEEYVDRPWEVEPGGLEGFEHMRGPAAVLLWLDDGSVLATSRAAISLPVPPVGATRPVFSAVVLADGRPGRLCQVWLPPRAGHENGVEVRPSGRRVGISVARGVEGPVDALARFRLLLAFPTLGVIALVVVATSFWVRTLLGHLAPLSTAIAALDPRASGERLELRGVPRELRAPFTKLNELLRRIDLARARERRVNVDVSHELRTPLAALRSIVEVAASRQRSGAEYRAALDEALSVVTQMQSTMESVLALARAGSGQASVAREKVLLRDLVDGSFRAFAQKALERGLRFENRIAPDLALHTDPEKLRLVCANLLSNAVEYTSRGGWIVAEADPGRGVILAVRDSGPPLPAGLEERVFDPFFRGDAARTASTHCGIGLALVEALCELMSYRVGARNEPDGAVAFVISAGEGIPAPAGATEVTAAC